MSDSTLFRNPVDTSYSYASLEADLQQMRQEASARKALENAALEAASLNRNLPFSVDGQVTSPEQMLQYLLADIERNPNSVSANFVKSQLIQNPLVQEMAKQRMLPAEDIDDLAQKINQRHIAKANGQAVFDPDFGDKPLTDLVQDPNRPDAGFLERMWESTKEILGFTGRGETEAQLAEIDKQLSRYPTDFKLSFKKLQEVEKARMELENLQNLLRTASDPLTIEQLQQRIALQNDRITTLESHITSQDQANIQTYGQSFLQDWRKREGLKAQERALTPRYPTTVLHEREIAAVKQKHLNMGHSTSFTDPQSWVNGYVKDYVLTMADPDVISKEIAPEVLPWVGINFLIDAGAAALTGGASLPASIAKWTAMIGMGANSAYQAIDKNIDAYFEKHGTTAGFSELRSYIMEGIAFGLDMYGGRMLGQSLPASVDKLFGSARKEAMQSISKDLEIGAKMAEATGSAEPFKAAVKNAYQILTGSTLMRKMGEFLSESGAKASALQGRGKIRQALGAAISGTEKPLPYLGRVGIEPTISAAKDAALSLAAENMMSETARQVGRQNGMDANAVIESGLKGLVAGPVGRAGGKVFGAAAEAKQTYDKYSASVKDMLSDQQMTGYRHHIEDALKSNNINYKKELYHDIKQHRDGLDSKLNDESIAETNKTRLDNTVEKYQKLLSLEKGKVEQFSVNSKGQIVEAGTKGSEVITAPKVELQTINDSDTEAVKATKKAFNKDIQKAYKKAYNEIIWKDARQAQRTQLQEMMDKLEKEGELSAEFIESEKTEPEIAKEQTKKDEGHDPLSNEVAKQIEAGKEVTNYKEISADDLRRLKDIKGKDIVRDVVDRFQGKSEEEQKQLHEAINKGDINQINELLKANKKTEEGKEPEPLEDIFTQEDYQKHLNDLNQNRIDLDNLSEGILKDMGIIDKDESIDMEQIQEEINQLTSTEAKELQQAAESVKKLKDVVEGEEGKEAIPEPIGEITVSEQAKKIKEAIDKHNKELEEKSVTGDKEVTELSKEAQEEVETATIGGKETISKVRENKYAKLVNLSQNKEFWKSSALSEEDGKALLKAANEAVKIPWWYSNKDALKAEFERADSFDKFIAAYTKLKGANPQRFLASVAKELYNSAEAKREKVKQEIKSKNIRMKQSEVHGYVGYSDRAILHNYIRSLKEEKPESKALKEKIDAYDGRFLFDKNLYNDEDYLNFVTFVCNTTLFKEGTLESIESLKQLVKNIKGDKEEAKQQELIQVLEGLLNPTPNNGWSINERSLAQLDLLSVSLLRRSNSGTTQNYKVLGDYLSTIKSALDYLIKEGAVTKDLSQQPGLWTGSTKYQARQWYAGEKAREYRKKFSTASDFIACNRYLMEALNAIDEGIVKQAENYSQFWSINDVIVSDADSDDVENAIKTWVNSQSVNVNTELYDFFEKHYSEVFTTMTEYWYRDVKMGTKKASNVLEQVLQDIRDPDVRRYLTVGEGKATDVGSVSYWKEKWEKATSPSLKGRLIEAFMGNRLTLAACLGIKRNIKKSEVNPTNFNRVVADLYENLNRQDVEKLVKKLKFSDKLLPYFYEKLRSTGFIDKTTYNELIRGAFQKDLTNKLERQLNINITPREVILNNNGVVQTWYVLNNYDIDYHFFKSTDKKDKGSTELAYKKSGTNSWIKLTDKNKVNVNGTIVASIDKADFNQINKNSLDTILKAIKWDGYIVTPASENKKLPEVNFTGPLSEKLENFTRAHYGELLVYKWLKDNSKPFSKKNTKQQGDFLKEFSNVFSYLNVKLYKYNTRKIVSVDNITYKDLDHLIGVIKSNADSGLTKEILNDIIKNNSKVNTGDMESVVDKYFDKNELRYVNDSESTEAQKTALAQAIQIYINKTRTIKNAIKGNRKGISFNADRGTLNTTSHNVSGLNKDWFKKNSRKSILLSPDGFANAVAQNPDLAVNEAFQAMLKAAESLYGKVTIPDSAFARAECDYAGRVLSHVIDVAVSSGVSAFARTSSETSEDFLNQLRVSAPGAARVYADPNSHIIDQNNFIESVGKMAAKVLGYDSKYAAYDVAVARLGQLAVLGLEKASIGFERVYIHRISGNVISPSRDKGADISDCIPAIRINQPIVQSELADAIKTVDSNGVTSNWVDKLLDVDYHTDDSLHTREKQITRDVAKFAAEYDIEKGTHDKNNWLTEDGNINVNQLNKIEGTTYKHKDKDRAKIIRLEDMAMVCLYGADGKIDPTKVVVFNHDAIEKTDYTQVVDTKLVTLAAQMVQGVDVNLDELFPAFEAMSVLQKDSDGTYKLADGISEEEVNRWDLDDLDNFLKDKPFLQMMLYTNSKYGMDPSTRSGKDWLNTRMTNLMDFRKMVKDISAFQNIEGENYFKKTGTINLYFSEMNTVNNRLFVKSAVFNYREFKHWRSVTSVNNIKNLTLKLANDNQKAQFVAPILFNLGFDVDKIATAKDILDIWNKLARTKEFKKLLKDVSGSKDYNKIYAAIQEYNDSIPKDAKNNKDTSYTSYKGAPKDKDFKISANFEAVTTLSKLSDIQRVTGGTRTRFIETDLTNLDMSVTGYDITVEVDGLTNGPSFKNIGSSLISNTDYQSHFLLGATGASNLFYNIREAYENNILDTYNLNGRFVRDALTTDTIREFFRGSNETSKVMQYLNVLYKPAAKEKSDHMEPPSFMDSMIDVMAEIFDRDFMKPPTMVIGYEAGKASVIQTLLTALDRRFSNDCANGDNTELNEWHKEVMKLIGKTDIVAEYVINNRVERITISSDGMVDLPVAAGGTTHITALSKDQMHRLSISHNDIAGLRDHLSNLFGRLYDSIAAKKELVQKPYQQLGECAQTLANAYDVIVKNAINNMIDDNKGIPSADYLDTVDKIINKVYEDFNAIIRVGVEQGSEKSLLSLTKEEVRDSVIKAMGIYTTAGEGRFIKSTIALAGRVSLGAGTVPMFIHSYDSSVVHTMLQKVMDISNERILTIHDALLANLSQLAGEWETPEGQKRTIDGVLKMNQGHYESGHEQIRSFADICQCLHKAIDSLEARRAEFNLPSDSLGSILNELKDKQEMMFKTVVSLASQRRAFYEQQKALADAGRFKEMWMDYQYSAFGDADTGEALGGFRPTSEQLTNYISAIDSILDNVNFPPTMSSIRAKLTQVLKQYLTEDQRGNVFGNNGELTNAALSHLTNLNDFLKWLENNTGWKPNNTEALSMLTQIFEGRYSDPELKIRDTLIQSFRQAESATTHISTTDKSIDGTTSFLKDIFSLVGTGKFGIETPTKLLITDDNNILHNRAIEAVYALSRLPAYLQNTVIGELLGFREMTHLHKESGEQQDAFIRLITPFYQKANKITLSAYDAKAPATLVYSDSFDFVQLEENFRNTVNKQHYLKGNNFTYYQALADWFSHLKKDMETLITANPKSKQFVFTMRSQGDIFRMLALQEVLSSEKYNKQGISITVIPAISNLSQASAAVDEEVAVYQKLMGDNPNLRATYFTGTIHSHNVQLQQAIMGFNISPAVYAAGALATRHGDMLVMDTDKYVTAKKVKTQTLYREGNKWYRKDELGKDIDTKGGHTSYTYDTDLLTTPIHGREKYGYNIRIPYSDNFTPKDYYTVLSMDQYKKQVNVVDALTSFDEIIGNDSSTVIVQTEAGGSILSKGLTAYAKEEGTTLYAAYAKYREQWEKKWKRWEDSNHGEYEWKLYMTPIVVSVPNHLRENKVFVFTPVIDNTVTIEELRNGIRQSNTGETRNPAQIIEGSTLSTRLYRLQDRTTVDALEELRNKYKGRSGNFRVVIPTELMPRDQLWEGSFFNPMWLKTNNATYLKEVFAKHHLAANGVRIPIDSTIPYNNSENVEATVAIPEGVDFLQKARYINLADVPLAYYSQLIHAQEQIQFEDIEDKVGSLTKDNLIPLVGSLKNKAHSYLGKVPVLNKFTHSYVGTVSDIPTEYKWRLTDDILAYDRADEQFRQLMLRSIERDKAKGLDTSLVEQSLDLMDNLVTLAYIRIGQTKGIESSLQTTLLAGEIGEREFLNIGTTGLYESESEAFMHEMLHTLWRHLNAHEPGLRKKLSDMYNYVASNFNINYFEDGNTVRNMQIMDAVFSKNTVDNVEEFLCYYLSNRSFHNAVNAMASSKGTKLSAILESNTRGIFRKLLNTAQNLLAGKLGLEKEPDTIEGLAQKALSVALNYNNKYWLRKQNLIESATKEEISLDMILGLKEPAYKVLDKIYSDSVFTSAVQAAVQKIYRAFGFGPNQAKSISTNIGATEEFNRITETGEQLTDNLIEAKRDYLNAEDNFMNDLMSSLEGVSRSQYDYLILRTKSKAVIDQQREQLGSAINEAVRRVLSNVPEKIAKHLTMQFIHTDISCLFRNTDLKLEQIKKVLTDKEARDKHIATLERSFANDRYANYYKNAAKGLAQYLVTGFNPTGLNYRNAYEILSRAGSKQQTVIQAGSALHNTLDQLISLYTLDLLDTSKVSVFKSIPIDTLNQLAVIHNAVKDSDNKEVYFGNSAMHLHVPKGELHGGTTNNRYEIIPEAELKAYEWNGYKKVSDAELDPFFKQHTSGKFVMVRAAYKSPAVTTAGIFTMTNIFKGRTQAGINIGSVMGQGIDSQTSKQFRNSQYFADLQQYIQTRIENLNTANPALLQTPTSGNMLLNFNVANHLAGATFEVNPIEKLKQTGKDVKVTSVLGDLYGSVVERTLTPRRNTAIAESVIEIYENATDKENFVWVAANSENEKYRDLYDHLPFEVKNIAKEKYGDRGLPVRLKALNTVFGYANLSANDTKAFIQAERKAQDNADKLASQFSVCARNIFYNKYFGNAETFARWLARVGKTQIVIKGITTSWFNVLSNCVLLSMNGLSAKQVLEYQMDGLRQFDLLRQYKYQLRQLKQKQIFGQYTDADARAEANINKSIKSLPIYDLIENGVIANTIAEDKNESEALMQNVIKSVFPKGIIQTVANNLLITPNSMLYQILADFASLGDIGGKWALYRYNTERKMDSKEAARLSLNAFIDYSNPLPKQLQLVDDFAVLPFMKYALGIQNMLIRTLAKHPDRTLGWVFGVNSLLGVAHPFQSLLTPEGVLNRMQLPGELFVDSFGSLPSNRLLNWYGEVNP